MRNSKILRLPVLLLTMLLAACGNNAATPVSTTPVIPSASVATSAPVAVIPSVTPLASTSVAPANTTAPAAQVASGPLAGIAQGTTPEGYHMLGNPSAPGLLVMYSDFL